MVQRKMAHSGEGRLAERSETLERGRRHYEDKAWADSFELLSQADEVKPLGADDLERLALSAYLIGREERFHQALERAHAACLQAEQPARAARCAFWLGITLLFRGEKGRGTGWLSGARRLIEREGLDCCEAGYLLLASAEGQIGARDHVAAFATAGEACEIGVRFGDGDLVACARHVQGRALIGQGQVEKGLSFLDEAMVSVTTGQLFPLMTGLIYCSVIAACQEVYALARAREWTMAMAEWCKAQPQMVAFTRDCLVHRSQILRLYGAWADAFEEACRACERVADGDRSWLSGAALYQQAEVHRLKGEDGLAEKSYRNASQWEFDPQPGLSLLRLAQGHTDRASASIRRAVAAAEGRDQRARLLPAYVTIMLAAGHTDEARQASAELTEIANALASGVLDAMAAQALGSVELVEGDAGAAIGSLRRALAAWRRIEAPYEAATVRAALGLACRALGDEEGATMELDAARRAFERLGAVPDLARVDALMGSAPKRQPHGLTPRELQVLGLIATGKTNKAIAAELCLSERTVDRHVSNIFNKLDVPTRTAAAAWAYERKLV